ncbi:hypothetical protein BG015_005387 [Linnemannia schmuckeri]|uniref:HMG box domain-containing protein n=1 Tax=Linnemannia schmuckeri TaxID=64567 RepID=A0A9P5S9A3_9FUNG|nr:hypothetical protein BG015_005387 [Linnemannia schmuckeri]
MGVYVQTHSAMQQKARKKIREEGKVKRTSNCFIMYRNYMHPIIVARYGHQNNKEISRLAGRCWRNEPESIKKIYRQQAAEEKIRHAALYPSYKYTPAKPASKDGGNTDLAKPKARCPWNKPTRLSPPAAKLSSSKPISPLPSLHEPEGTEDDIVNPEEDESSEHASSPQAIERDKSTPSAAHSTATNKPSVLTERGFVVTETPLFDFRGNADLSEKNQTSKSRIGPRPNRLNQRLPGLADPLSSKISTERTSSITSVTPTNPFTFVLQGSAMPNAPLPAGLKGVSGLTQVLAHQRSGSQVTTSVPALARTPVSETPPGWSNMVGQPQVSGATPQQQWSVAQPPPLPVVTKPLSAVFQGNIGISATDSTADQNWAQQPPPQPAPPVLPRLASNLVQSPQPSTPIQIPVPAVTATSHFSGHFDSLVYNPTIPTSTSPGTIGFPWQLDVNFDGTPGLGLLYTPESLSTTPTTFSSAPLMTMHFQQGILSSSPVHSHSTLGHLLHATVSSFEDDFGSAGSEQELSSCQISSDMFGDGTWSHPLHMPSPNIADLDQQRLLSASSSNSSMSSSSGSIYPDIAISAWTTLGEPHVPYPVCFSNISSPSFNHPSRNDINLANDNDNNNSRMNINDRNAGVDLTSSDSIDDGHALMISSQSVPLSVGSQTLPWGDEEQLKMSISYFEDIVQQQKALLSLRQQWRQQAQVVQPLTSALVSNKK